MDALLRPARYQTGSVRIRILARICAALCLLLPACCVLAQGPAATTTISGKVYDPRTTTSALPLPNVLVYITTGVVAPLPGGVQCLTYSSPTGVISTYTAVDGTFTLSNVPVNTNYTLVIQAGKWRRRFSEAVSDTPISGLQLHMPANHSEGDIPMIAVVTGLADGVECVLRDMGVDDTEFTDDTGSVNPDGHIHLYAGDNGPGALMSPSTPDESTLTGVKATLNNYDVVMFPCQGQQFLQPADSLANLGSYADAGGRIFATHYAYAYLDPNPPLNAPFTGVADWEPEQSEPKPDPGIATINTSFDDGANLAQWLTNAGSTVAGTTDQVQIGTLRRDLKDIIPPTQNWLNLNNPSYGNPIMQMTFNTPVGAPAQGQCGRVVFNEYHVFDQNLIFSTVDFPRECPSLPANMSPQEQVLEYELFDLSAFVQPVVVPTLKITFNPSPVAVQPSESGGQVTIDVTNTSSTVDISSSAILTIKLPPLLTATSLTDAGGGWNCAVSTLTCTRTASLAGSASDSVVLGFDVSAYPTGGPPNSGAITATVSSRSFSSNVSATDKVTYQQEPVITWATPAPIVYGTRLSGFQLDARANVAGSFTYDPAAGTVLAAGKQTLQANFTPANTAEYLSSSATVTLTVTPFTPKVTVRSSANPVFLTDTITFPASVQPVGAPATGAVTFYDGTTEIGTAILGAGQARISTDSLALGTHSITAVYAGDNNYAGATSAAISELVEDFSITGADGSTTPTTTANPNRVAVFPLAIAPIGGPTLPYGVILTAKNLPLGASVAFTPAKTRPGAEATNVTLNVNLYGSTQSTRNDNPFTPSRISIALGVLLLPFAGLMRKRARGWQRLVMLALASAALAIGLNGCGGQLSPNNFAIEVIARSGNLKHTITATLTIK